MREERLCIRSARETSRMGVSTSRNPCSIRKDRIEFQKRARRSIMARVSGFKRISKYRSRNIFSSSFRPNHPSGMGKSDFASMFQPETLSDCSPRFVLNAVPETSTKSPMSATLAKRSKFTFSISDSCKTIWQRPVPSKRSTNIIPPCPRKAITRPAKTAFFPLFSSSSNFAIKSVTEVSRAVEAGYASIPAAFKISSFFSLSARISASLMVFIILPCARKFAVIGIA